MNGFLRVAVGILAVGILTGGQAWAAERAVAVTFDDLPGVSVVANDPGGLAAMNGKLLDAVRKHRIPAVGFVNEGKLFVQGAAPRDAEARKAVLRMWVDAGLELGNHTYSHRSLNQIPLDQFQADLLRGEQVTRALMEARGGKLRYFRHPFLHVGPELKKRRAFEAFLASHGYIVAPVTVDNDEYVYAAVYANALRRRDTETAERVAKDYLRYMDEVFGYFEDVSRRVAGREIRQVLLLHANALNADWFDAVAEQLKRRGYRFISLADALEDEAYRRPDNFVGEPGNSWFNHWEITAGRAPVPTPSASDWVSKALESLQR